MAESHWLANRAQTLQNSCLDPQTGQITDSQMFSLYLRYQTTHTRAFHKCLNDLVKLRAETRRTANTNKAARENPGFEAQYAAEIERLLENRQSAAALPPSLTEPRPQGDRSQFSVGADSFSPQGVRSVGPQLFDNLES